MIEENFMRWTKDDIFAADFLNSFFYCIHLLDDLVDKDVDRSDEDITKVVFYLLVSMPRNPFFHKHVDYLTTVIQGIVLQWRDATRWEKARDKELMKRSFALKDTAYDIVSHVAFLVGGYDHMLEVNDELKALTMRAETLDTYLAEFKEPQDA